MNAYHDNDTHEYKGRRNAEGLHRLMFMCPSCNSHNTLSAKGNDLYCRSCSFKAHYDYHGYLHSSHYKTPQNMVEIDASNKEAFQDYIINTPTFTLSETGDFSEVFRRRRKAFGQATVTLNRDGLTIAYKQKKHQDIMYDFNDIEVLVMQQKEVLVMYLKGEPAKMLYIKNSKQTSAYQFVIAHQILQNIKNQPGLKTSELQKLTLEDMGLK